MHRNRTAPAKSINVVPYNLNWPRLFAHEAALIKGTLKNACVAVHHIGSTAIPGLAAKDTIDICLVVDQLPNSLLLEKIGYTFKGELNIPFRHYFSKNTDDLRINMHAVKPDHHFITLNQHYIGYLTTHDGARAAYQALKIKLASDPHNFERIEGIFSRYTLEKHAFINDVLNTSGYDRLGLTHCAHYDEWEAYHRIRDEQIFTSIAVVYDRHHPTLTAHNHFHFVLSRGTTVVSVAHVEFLNEDEAALRSLATDESFKCRGYGKYLMQMLERWVLYHGRGILKMHANPNAEMFYRRLGYIDMSFDDPCISPAFINLGKRLGLHTEKTDR